MFEEPARYHSYLLNMWEERSEDPNVRSRWRFSLEDSLSGKRRGFSDLEELTTALKKEIEQYNQKQK